MKNSGAVVNLPAAWQEFFQDSVPEKLWLEPLLKSEARRCSEVVFPPPENIFRAFELLEPGDVKVVLLGQDPYHGENQAEGLAFSVPSGVKLPPSLRNIFKEYSADLGRQMPDDGHLGKWATGGVLLLNAVLTVRSGSPGSHAALEWERFTDAVIAAISAKTTGRVFILWGSYAAKKIPLIDSSKHRIIAGVHPSPLSAYRGFFGSHPFSQAEEFLAPWRWPGV